MPPRWLILKSIVCIAAITLVLTVTPIDRLMERIAQSNWRWFLIALTLQGLLRLLTALRMYWLARRQALTLSFGRFLMITLTTAFYGLFLPGLAGGAITFVKYRQYGADSTRSLINILINKGLAIIAIALLTLIAWCWDYFRSASWLLPPALLFYLTAPLLLRRSIAACGWFGRKLAHLIGKRTAKPAAYLTDIADRLQTLRQLNSLTLTGFLNLAVLQHGVALASMLAYAAALSIAIPDDSSVNRTPFAAPRQHLDALLSPLSHDST